MNGKIVKFIVYAVTLCVLNFVLEYLNRRDKIPNDPAQNDNAYIVRVTSALKMVYGTIFWLGMIMLAFFCFLCAKDTPGVTDGHLWFSIATAAMGLFVVILASRWRITVRGDQLSIHRLFRRSQTLGFSELEKAVEETKRTKMGVSSRLVLYRDGKKLITVGYLSENYDRFLKTLKRYGKLA